MVQNGCLETHFKLILHQLNLPITQIWIILNGEQLRTWVRGAPKEWRYPFIGANKANGEKSTRLPCWMKIDGEKSMCMCMEMERVQIERVLTANYWRTIEKYSGAGKSQLGQWTKWARHEWPVGVAGGQKQKQPTQKPARMCGQKQKFFQKHSAAQKAWIYTYTHGNTDTPTHPHSFS